ncbi:MAG TPA: nitrous oxide reductase accessory protein NosL [Gammaproteobacteria bacterium]|nr:nitrous oxide reductase accessory protein NosL [Gammaproteobacteria bacterium]
MEYNFMKRFQLVCLLVLVFILSACNSDKHDSSRNPAVDINSGDECHLCGMFISRFPGPKGEAYVRDNPQAFKFCSTRDLFSYILQPDVKTIVKEIYVHDMGKTDWQKPAMQASYFTDARTAYYVINQPLKGAMGHTIASFAKKQDADAFIKKHGGKLLRFNDITLDIVADIQQPPMGH